MRYLIYDGGNLLSLPWELTQSAQIGDYYVIPTEHQKRRSIELEKHIDTASRNWTGHYDGLFNESDKPLIIETSSCTSSRRVSVASSRSTRPRAVCAPS